MTSQGVHRAPITRVQSIVRRSLINKNTRFWASSSSGRIGTKIRLFRSLSSVGTCRRTLNQICLWKRRNWWEVTTLCWTKNTSSEKIRKQPMPRVWQSKKVRLTSPYPGDCSRSSFLNTMRRRGHGLLPTNFRNQHLLYTQHHKTSVKHRCLSWQKRSK